MKTKQIRLKQHEAEALNIEPRKNDSGRNTTRYYLDKDKLKELKELRKNHTKTLEVETKTTTKPNDYKGAFVLSAFDYDKGRMLSLEEFCIKYNIDFNKVTSSKFLPYHYKEPTYNVVMAEEKKEANLVDFEELKRVLKKQIKKTYKPKQIQSKRKKQGVLKWSDLHFGAYIRNIMHVKDFDKDILEDGLLESVNECNDFGFSTTHVHINGDLIESFSGLNHINSWQSMDKDLIGANAVKLCSKMLNNVLSKIDNLGCVKIVAGNHDRLSKNNDEDVKGGAAELIAFCLELMGYDVEFHPYVITQFVDGINHINLHGDKGISKKSTEKIILDYGIQGEYNLINEGHLHSVIEKLSIKQRESFEVLKDDSILHRRFYLPSFFTGNYYSATLGYTTNPGYYIIYSKGKNKPQFFNGSV